MTAGASRDAAAGPGAGPAPRVLVLADDLIWATRLQAHVVAAGGTPVPVRAAGAFEAAVATAPDGAIVDLTARAYDGLAAVQAAARAQVPVLAVAQHDDAELRQAARAAGAARVYAYRALFEHGPRELQRWLGTARRHVDAGTVA